MNSLLLIVVTLLCIPAFTELIQAPDVNHFPIAEFATSETKDPKRRARGEKRNKSHWGVHPDSVSDSTVRVDSVDLSLPALPINESQAVIIGKISDAKAYLSNDKTDVYSVFVVLIEEILKHPGKLTVGSAVEAEREGGRVKFPSGRTHLYKVSEQDMPRAGGRSGYGSADVTFRSGKFTVYISGGADIGAEPDTRSLSEAERIEREKSEATRLCRKFARHIVRVLDAP
jgi:hypothetical protein